MPNLRLTSFTPTNRNNNFNPVIRVDQATTGTAIILVTPSSTSFGGKGYLIGMLGLTYIKAQGSSGSNTLLITLTGIKPSIRLTNI